MNREPCPDSESLAAYFSGRNPAIRQHVLECDRCAGLLKDLEAFDGPPSAVAQWPAISSRLQTNFEDFLQEHAKDAQRKPRRSLSLLWNPVLAYALVLVLVYPAWLGLFSRRSQPQVQNTRLVQLDSTRSAHFDAEAASGVGVVTLAFFIPIRDGFQYKAAILDTAGHTLVGPFQLQPYDSLGHFATTCPPLTPRPEGFILRVTEMASNGSTGREFPFSFRP